MIKSLTNNIGKVKSVELLGGKGNLSFIQTESELNVELPIKDFGDLPFVLKIKGLKL